MYSIVSFGTSANGKAYGYAEFLCETEVDLDVLLTGNGDVAPGSLAHIIASGNEYVLSPQKQWILRSTNSQTEVPSQLAKGAITWKETLKMTPRFSLFEAKEAMAIASYGDYLYVGGAYGLQKFNVIKEHNVAVAKNQFFSQVNMSGHRIYQMAVSKDGNHLYVAHRLTSPGYTGEEYAGALSIFSTNDLSLEKQIPYNAKCSGVELNADKTMLALNMQLGGFALYDISTAPADPTLLYEYRARDGQQAEEWQKGEFLAVGDKQYYVVAGYTDGIHIYDITAPASTTEVARWEVNDGTAIHHVFDVTISYPYIYATIAPIVTLVNTEDVHYGVVVLDVSDMANITSEVYDMDTEDINLYAAGDPMPCEIERYGDKLLLNNGDKGVAVFSVLEDGTAQYRGCIPCDGEPVHSLHTTADGRIFVGCAYVNPANVRLFRGV